jgi:hypothetical protein
LKVDDLSWQKIMKTIIVRLASFCDIGSKIRKAPIRPNKKNMCVSGYLTYHIFLPPTLNFFFTISKNLPEIGMF